MTDAERKLEGALRDLRPSARDAAFRMAVLERQARRRFQVRLGAFLAGAAVLMVLTAFMAPALDAAVSRVIDPQALPIGVALLSAILIGGSLFHVHRPRWRR